MAGGLQKIICETNKKQTPCYSEHSDTRLWHSDCSLLRAVLRDAGIFVDTMANNQSLTAI